MSGSLRILHLTTSFPSGPDDTGGRTLKYIPVKVKARKADKSNIRIFKDGVRFFIISLVSEQICQMMFDRSEGENQVI